MSFSKIYLNFSQGPSRCQQIVPQNLPEIFDTLSNWNIAQEYFVRKFHSNELSVWFKWQIIILVKKSLSNFQYIFIRSEGSIFSHRIVSPISQTQINFIIPCLSELFCLWMFTFLYSFCQTCCKLAIYWIIHDDFSKLYLNKKLFLTKQKNGFISRKHIFYSP